MKLVFVSFYGIIPYIGCAEKWVALLISLPESTPQRKVNSVKLDLVAEDCSDFLYKLGIIEIDSHEMIYMGTAKKGQSNTQPWAPIIQLVFYTHIIARTDYSRQFNPWAAQPNLALQSPAHGGYPTAQRSLTLCSSIPWPEAYFPAACGADHNPCMIVPTHYPL
jgi:hypothetical protein